MEVQLTLKRTFQKGFITFELPKEAEAKEALKKVFLTCHDRFSDFVTVTFSTPYKKRSTGKNSQNHHLNGHIVQICNETGNAYETIKYCVKMRAVEAFGYPFETVDGYIVPKSEKNCSTEECAKLIEAAHLYAAEKGIILREIEE